MILYSSTKPIKYMSTSYTSSNPAPQGHSNKSKKFIHIFIRAPDTEIWPFLYFSVIFFKNENFLVCVILGEK